MHHPLFWKLLDCPFHSAIFIKLTFSRIHLGFHCSPWHWGFCCRLLLAWKRTKNDKNIGRGHLLYVTLKSCSQNTLSIGRKHRKLTSRPSVLWRRQIAVINVVDFGTKPVSSFRSMRSRHVTKSNGVVEQKSSFRKLPNNYTMRRFVAYKSKTHRRGNLLTIHKRYFRLLQSSMNKVLKVLT